MKIIILRIPSLTTRKELKDLVSNLLSKRLRIPFIPRPEITSCEIVRIKDNLGIIEHHGLISIWPEGAADWLLGHFKGQHLHNKLVLAKKYVERDTKAQQFLPEDDRRRPNLEISKRGEPQVETNHAKKFHRKHGI